MAVAPVFHTASWSAASVLYVHGRVPWHSERLPIAVRKAVNCNMKGRLLQRERRPLQLPRNQFVTTIITYLCMKNIILLSCLLLAPAFALAGKYKGKPFKQHRVPCTVEAEDYDLGGEGTAFHCKNNAAGDQRAYRVDPVNIASGGSGLVLGGNDDGNWTSYTLNVAESGMYSVATVCSSGVDNGRFELRVDGEPVCRVQKVPNSGWNSYTPVEATDIPLKKGRHVFQWYTYGGMNVDKFVFTRTGDYVKGALPGRFNYEYPLTQQFGHNPLFVSLPSQMYGSPFTGNLYTADPSAHVWHIDGKDVLYVYASHDMEPARGCDRMDRYHVFSTEDLVNWTDHGEILNADDVREQTGIGTPGFMWAPDAAYNAKDGLYYFLFPHTEKATRWVTTRTCGACSWLQAKALRGLSRCRATSRECPARLTPASSLTTTGGLTPTPVAAARAAGAAG